MIYYYFGSKEGLYLAVLEEAYRRIRDIESELHLQDLEPEQALRRLVAFTFDHHLQSRELHPAGDVGKHQPRTVPGAEPAHPGTERAGHRGNPPAVRAGREGEGLPRRPGPGGHAHASISALSFFNVSNRHTFGLIFKLDTRSPAYIAHRRDSVIEMIVRFMRAP